MIHDLSKYALIVALLSLFVTIEVQAADYTYSVEKVGNDLHVKFNQITEIRHHTNPQYAPYHDRSVTPSDTIKVAKGQWLELKKDGKWFRASDADNR
jgi:hypothetical protein